MKIVKIVFFSTKSYDKTYFSKAATELEKAELENEESDESKVKFVFDYISDELNSTTAVFAKDHDVVCVSANDSVNADIAKLLSDFGVKIIALRSAGYNNVDIKAIAEINSSVVSDSTSEENAPSKLSVVKVNGYSAHSTAEFAVALLQALNRKIYRAFSKTRDGNFDNEGLIGTEIYGKTVGIIGAGKIGKVAAEIFKGYGATVLLNAAHQDQTFSQKIESDYVNLEEIFKNSDFIMIFCPLLSETRHIINSRCISLMKKDALIVNTGRSSLIDTTALLDALISGRIKGVAFDIFEEDKQNLYGDDWNPSPIRDENFEKLLRLPNVLMTHRQAYLTTENLESIAKTTLENIKQVVNEEECENLVN